MIHQQIFQRASFSPAGLELKNLLFLLQVRGPTFFLIACPLKHLFEKMGLGYIWLLYDIQQYHTWDSSFLEDIK